MSVDRKEVSEDLAMFRHLGRIPADRTYIREARKSVLNLGKVRHHPSFYLPADKAV